MLPQIKIRNESLLQESRPINPMTREVQMLSKNIALKEMLIKKMSNRRVNSLVPSNDLNSLKRKGSIGPATATNAHYQRSKQYNN